MKYINSIWRYRKYSVILVIFPHYWYHLLSVRTLSALGKLNPLKCTQWTQFTQSAHLVSVPTTHPAWYWHSMRSAHLVMAGMAHLMWNFILMVFWDLVALFVNYLMTRRSMISRLSLPLVMPLCMFTVLCNLVNTFLSIMCGHFYLVLSVTVLGSFSVTAILIVLLMDCVTPGFIVTILPLVLSVFLFLLLPEDMTLSQGEAYERDSQYKGELHSD